MSETGKGLSGFGGKIVTNLTAMGIFGVLSTSFVVSFASLVFSSSCPEYLAASVALFLLAGCVLSIIIASLSSYSGVIAMIQDVPVAVSGLIALSLAGMLTDTDPQTLFANIFAAIALSTLLTGACFLLLGTFKLGNLVRFIPYPVMGGFLAATGWLLFKGGLQVSTGIGFELLHPVAFFQRIDYPQLACAVVFGVGLLVLTRRFPASMLVAPGTILGSLVLFLLAAGLLGYSTEDLGNHGWLLGPLPDQPLWRSVAFPDFSLID
ncbi:MAG: SulP family inorganic anion transporter, partial [Deltaproteobacteria bacterium]|nr:SulP family inorganic anion transporter [Deltaproteobacteria bacterium]